MVTKRTALTGKGFLKALCYTAAFDTIIAVFLTVIGFGPQGLGPSGFYRNFIFSQCIGLLCCSFIMTGQYLAGPQTWLPRLVVDWIGLILGIVAGLFIGSIITGLNPSFFIHQFGFLMKVLFGSLLFGTVIHYFFSIHEKISVSETIAQEERIKRLTSEKQAIETNLRLLQAQIEPHFLFNTLSNILSLLDREPERGKSMLSDLTRYLRTSLSKTRRDISTVGQEIELIQDYLKIFKVRMGERLRFGIEVPAELKDHPFPPMLIQPLVENAIKHGIEPKIDGGEILIKADTHMNGSVRVEVTDTGLGLHEGSNPGIGIANVKARLESLYGNKAQFILEENKPSGLKATIEVPGETRKRHHSR